MDKKFIRPPRFERRNNEEISASNLRPNMDSLSSNSENLKTHHPRRKMSFRPASSQEDEGENI